MEIREIDYILAICDSGSMLRAAEKLFITQSALSKYIQNLETRIGYPLFYRQKKSRLVLTPAGEIFVKYARRIAGERDALLDELEKRLAQKMNVCIGMGLNITDRHFNEIFHDFKARYPECNISIRTQHTRQNIIDVEKGLLDFSSCSFPNTDGRFDFFPVSDDYIQLAIPESHPLLKKTNLYEGTDKPWIDIAELQGEPFIFQDENCWIRTMIDRFLEQNHFTPTVFASTNSTNAALRLVEKGVGLALCSSGLSAGYHGIRFLYVGTPPFSFISGLIFRKGETVRPEVKYLASLFGKYNADARHLQDPVWSLLADEAAS